MKQLKEQFKPIKNYEGLYEISNFGRVKSLAKKWHIGNTNAVNKKDTTIMKSTLTIYGYFNITLKHKGTTKTIPVHLLVWDHFGNGKRDKRKLQVDHIDGVKTNNYIGNLQLLTQRANISKGFMTKKTTSKYIGVSSHSGISGWRSDIYINGTPIGLGNFKNEIDAANEYQRALKEFNEKGKVTVNSPLMKRKTSKYRGVSYWKKQKKWCASIGLNKRKIHLGYFDNEEDAYSARKKAERELL